MSGPALGITGLGVHVPRYRLSAETLGAVWGGAGSGTRAVANYDEDSLTMAPEAGLAALGAGGGASLGFVCLASTTAPYAEKSSAAVLAAVLDCGPAVSVADLGGSLRAGTIGLRLALDAVRAGSARDALVAAADLRLAPPGSDLEPVWGDGAAAVRVGLGDGVIARLLGVTSHTHEFSDVWRPRRVALPRGGRSDLRPRLRVRAPDGRGGAAPPRRDGGRARRDPAGGRVRAGRGARRADPAEPRSGEGVLPQVPLLTRIGNTGVGSPLLALVACLAEAEPGDRILLVGYGSGADALRFERLAGECHRPLPLGLAHEPHEPLVGDEVRPSEVPDLAGAEAAVERERGNGSCDSSRLMCQRTSGRRQTLFPRTCR